jgi:hypothetical protein
MEIPAILAGPKLVELLGRDFHLQRLIYDTETRRLLFVDLERQKFHAMTIEKMAETWQRFLLSYLCHIQPGFNSWPLQEQERFSSAYDQAVHISAGVTAFKATAIKRPTSLPADCRELSYSTDGKPGGRLCSIDWARIPSRKEAEAVFGLIVGLESFGIAVGTHAPGLIGDLATAPGAQAHSLHLVRVQQVVSRPQLVSLEGFSTMALPGESPSRARRWPKLKLKKPTISVKALHR